MDTHFTIGAACGAFSVPCAISLTRSASQKITQDIRLFEEAIFNYRLLPGRLISTVARAVIALECLTASALFFILGVPLIGAGLLAAAGGFFAAVQCSALWRGLKISCGCHGTEAKMIGWNTLIAPAWFLISGVTGGAVSIRLRPEISATFVLSYLLTGLAVYWLQSIARQTVQIFRWRQHL